MIAVNQRTFLAGPAGSGKTTLAVEHLDALLPANPVGASASILVLAPQRSLLRPYQAYLERSELPGREEVEVSTMAGLAQRSVTLMWPAVAAEMGFAQPNEPPTFLSLETAQYYMEIVVRPLMSERLYFESVRVPPPRLYSQLLDNLNKAALVNFPYTDVSRRLIEAWEGPSAQTITYTQVQDCINRFRAYCLAHNLLDFSLQIEVFKTLLQGDWFRRWLHQRYRHLIVDNVEEDSPFAHDVLRAWLPETNSALLVYDTEAGYRSFLGADARSGYALRSLCDRTIDLTDSHVMSSEMQHLEAEIVRIFDGHSDLPTRISQTRAITADDLNAIEFGGGRFYPQMLDWVADQIGELLRNAVAPPDIAVLTPFLGDALRFALEGRLHARQIPTRSLRPSRALNDEVVTRDLMTLANLAYTNGVDQSDRITIPPQADVAHALTLSIADLDPARGHLLAERLYRVRDGKAELNPFDMLKPELQDRIGYEMGARYDRLRQWLSEHQGDTALPLDHFLAKLFGEVLSQPGFGFHDQVDAGRVTAQLIESSRKFRQTVGAKPATEIDGTLARDYIQMVSAGVVAASYVVSPYAETPDAILLAPAYTFLLSNEAVNYQFWLNAGSLTWWERLYQPLTHPYVLTREWPAGQKWTDRDEQAARRAVLLRLVRGLMRRCRTRIYLAISTLNEQGFEERGPLLTLIQQVLRDSA